jgi:hypothetical protein
MTYIATTGPIAIRPAPPRRALALAAAIGAIAAGR